MAINLNELRKKFDAIFENETEESFNEWLKSKNTTTMKTDNSNIVVEDLENKLLTAACVAFRKQYPSVNSGDIQGFILGFKACEEQYRDLVQSHAELLGLLKEITKNLDKVWWNEVELTIEKAEKLNIQ